MQKQPTDKRLQHFQQVKADRKAMILAHKHAPGAARMDGTTRPLRPDLTLNGDTLALNCFNWREQCKLGVNSVAESYIEALQDVTKEFPNVTDINTALQLRRWKKRYCYLESQRENN